MMRGSLSALDLAEIACAEVVAHAAVEAVSLKLGMVPEVEELRAELEIAAPRFAEHEVLEEGNVPVSTSRATDGVSRRVAPGAGIWVRNRSRYRTIRRRYADYAPRPDWSDGSGSDRSWERCWLRCCCSRRCSWERHFCASDDAGNFPTAEQSSWQACCRCAGETECRRRSWQNTNCFGCGKATDQSHTFQPRGTGWKMVPRSPAGLRQVVDWHDFWGMGDGLLPVVIFSLAVFLEHS